MEAVSQNVFVAELVTKYYPLDGYKHIVDIGGGRGQFLVTLLRLNPHLTGTIFELPSVVEEGNVLLETDYKDIKGRLNFVEGNFFDSVPTGGDLYVSKMVIHDWNDESAKRILKTIHKAMEPTAKLLLLEWIIKEVGLEPAAILDMLIMVVFDGQERSKEEFRVLLDESGFNLTQTLSMPPHHHFLIEGVKKN